MERLEAFCKSQDWEILDRYVDDGYSGKNLDRPAAQRLLKDAKEKRFDMIAVYRLDRFSRRAVDVLRVVEEIFEPNGIYLKSATEPFDTQTISGRLMLSMLVAFAQFERESIAERVKVNMAHKAKGGEWCGGFSSPYGYENRDKKLYIIEHEAAVVRKMFDMYDSGAGYRSIALALNEQGLTTRLGNPWIHSRIREIIINPIYAGLMVWNRTERKGKKTIRRPTEEWIISEGEHEAIVDKQLFDRVQARMELKSHSSPRTNSHYALSGLIYCGKCGSKYRGWYKFSRKGEKVRYYRCGGYTDGIHCHSVSIRVEKLESAVLEELEKLELDEQGCLEAIREANDKRFNEENLIMRQIEETADNLARIDNRKKLVFDAYEKGAIQVEDLQNRIEQINKEKDALEGRQKDLDISLKNILLRNKELDNKLSHLKDIRKQWENGTDLQRQILARAIINRIVIIDRETFDLEVFS